jgi:hypothetical protein
MVSGHLVWEDTLREPFETDAWPITLQTNRGDILTRYYPPPIVCAANIRGAVLWLGGEQSGFEGREGELFSLACQRLQPLGVGGLKLAYRFPGAVDEAVHDSGIAIEFLLREGLQRIILVGQEFGATVAIRTAIRSPAVKGVVVLSPRATPLNS